DRYKNCERTFQLKIDGVKGDQCGSDTFYSLGCSPIKPLGLVNEILPRRLLKSYGEKVTSNFYSNHTKRARHGKLSKESHKMLESGRFFRAEGPFRAVLF
ncbi:hypothetical protein PV326_011213, partial [Microctonus aethiopoides]